ncbi:MAG TPA: hypothetical protein VMF61_03995 [Candidatus Acidoferrales bacterium]|nr:hypothetical protein [Candidatus Acidoferrales bacterium]
MRVLAALLLGGLCACAGASVAPEAAPLSAEKTANGSAFSLYVANAEGPPSGNGAITTYRDGGQRMSGAILSASNPDQLDFKGGRLYVFNGFVPQYGYYQPDKLSVYRPHAAKPARTIAMPSADFVDYVTPAAFDSGGDAFVAVTAQSRDARRNWATVYELPSGAAAWSRLFVEQRATAKELAVAPDGTIFALDRRPKYASIAVYAKGATKPRAAIRNGLDRPNTIAVAPSGALYCANASSITIYNPPSYALAQTIGEGVSFPELLAFDPAGDLYVFNGGSSNVAEYAPGATAPSRAVSLPGSAAAMAVGPDAGLYVAFSVTSRFHIDWSGIDVFTPGATSPARTIRAEVYDPISLTFGPVLR